MKNNSEIGLITNADLAVLGLVAEGPRHGYQVEQDIARRGMREWTEIGFSSIYYVLNKLEAAGWLESRPEEAAGLAEKRSPADKRGPARKVYSLTGQGWVVYRAAVLERLAQPRPRSADFALALANLPAVETGAARAAVQAQYAALVLRLEQVQAKKLLDRQAAGNLPPHVEALFSYSEAQLAAEVAWLGNFLSSGLLDDQGAIK